MPGPRFAAFVGSWNRPSKTRSLAEDIARRAVARFGGTSHVFDVAELGDEVSALRMAEGEAFIRHIDAFLAADALIVASPVYKGSYTGLFKHVIDLIDPAALAGKPVLLAATGGGEKHALVIEHQMRPLFGFFEARTLATGVYASAADFDASGVVQGAVSDRLDRAVEQFAAYLPAARSQPLRAAS